jgi:periplasmic protein TonB
MNFSQTQTSHGQRWIGLAFVTVLHLLVIYALTAGLAKKVMDVVHPPVETHVIEEAPGPARKTDLPLPAMPKLLEAPRPLIAPPQLELTPPPVQPPAQQPAPLIVSVMSKTPQLLPAEPTPTPPVTAPAVAPPNATPAITSATHSSATPDTSAKPNSASIGVVCPTQVSPSMPRKAAEEGTPGSVRARATIKGGKVITVEILSSTPRGVFDSAVRDAMSQYKCQPSEDEVKADQTFEFKFSLD